MLKIIIIRIDEFNFTKIFKLSNEMINKKLIYKVFIKFCSPVLAVLCFRDPIAIWETLHYSIVNYTYRTNLTLEALQFDVCGLVS